MLVTLAGIVISVRAEQPENELYSILITCSGILMAVRPEHELNADWLILVTLSGSWTLTRPEQLKKVPSAIPLIPSGIIKSPTGFSPL